jgi:hypothetical protein
MSAQTYLPEDAMIKRGLAALMEALGPVETARFLSLPRGRFGDYVEWHRKWQAGLDPQRFFDEVFGPVTSAEETSRS